MVRHGGRLSCRQSTVDSRIAECHASIHPDGGPALVVTVSLVRGAAAITLLAAPRSAAELRDWLIQLETRNGPGTQRQQHGQQTWQWVRHNTMIRLTTRLEGGQRVASVSLVDGPLLDGLSTP